MEVFDYADTVMALPLDVSDKNFLKVLNIKQSVASMVLTATARVRQDQLKPAQQDHMVEVLRRVKEARLGGQVAEQLGDTSHDGEGADDLQDEIEDREDAALAAHLFS